MHRANIQFPECGILGRALLTDHAPLVDALQEMNANASDPIEQHRATVEFNKAFPGFMAAITTSLRALDAKRLRSNVVTYFNYRVQAWALGYDADGTPPIRVIPAGIVTDPSGPTTFSEVSP